MLHTARHLSTDPSNQLDFELVGRSTVRVKHTSEKLVNEVKTRANDLGVLLQ
jgi:hypothetical protein